jgi:hypothetical protein
MKEGNSENIGSNLFVLFCNNFVGQEWKDTFIHSFTSFSGAFGGSTHAVTGLSSTHSMNLVFYLGEGLRTLEQSFGKFKFVPEVNVRFHRLVASDYSSLFE